MPLKAKSMSGLFTLSIFSLKKVYGDSCGILGLITNLEKGDLF